MKTLELLAPVGSHEMLSVAINEKVNAIYLGIKGINMRNSANNFEINELRNIVSLCHNNNIKVYLTLNTIIYNKEIEKIKNIIYEAKKAKIDAIICWDLFIIKYAISLNIPIHLSTQASVSNFETLKEYYLLGVKRFVLARECSIEDIKEIVIQSKKLSKDIEIEVFGHGAMCVAISGRCFISQYLYGNECSANRGKCIQPCRRQYLIKDVETNKELVVENNYVLSPKDLCTIPFLDTLLDTGISSLKIEGRNRSPEYLKIVISCYKEAIKAHSQGNLTFSLKDTLVKRLGVVYNRGFSSGFYLGYPLNQWYNNYGNMSKTFKTYVGKVLKVFKKIKVMEIRLNFGKIKINDNILIVGKKTGVIEQKITSIQKDVGQPLTFGKKGDVVAIKVNTLPNINDKIYLLETK